MRRFASNTRAHEGWSCRVIRMAGRRYCGAGCWRRRPIPSHTPGPDARIAAAAQRVVADGRTPGLAIGVVRDGTLVYARGFGYANIARHEAVTADTEFFAAGVTRQFTAAAVLLLVQDGKLRLDDKVTRFIPGLTNAPDVTVGQLLTQTSGLPYPSGLPAPANDFTRSIRQADLVAAVAALKPAARGRERICR